MLMSGLIYKHNTPWILPKYLLGTWELEGAFFMQLEFLRDNELVALDLMVTMALIVWL